jgi:hypothetical protein
MAQTKPVELTDVQFYALQMLTEQRGVNLIQLADLIGDMNPQGLEFMRRLGDPSHEALTGFLSQAKPDTLRFLTDLRKEEVGTLQSGIRIVVALQLIGWILKWGLGGLIALFLTVAALGEKVSVWLKLR